MSLLIFGVLIGWMRILWLVSVKYKCVIKLNHLPIISISTIVIITYIGALTGYLATSTGFIYITGLSSMTLSIINSVKRKRVEKILFNYVNVIFITLALILFGYFDNSAFFTWDEFSHWGLVVKDMYITDSLALPDSAVIYTSYPPGLTLFQYIFGKYSGGFNEGLVFSATSVFVISGLISAIPIVGRSHVKSRACFASLVLIFMMEPLFDWQFSLADHVLGVTFGAAAIIGMDQKEYFSQRMLWSVPLLMLLVLLKPTGIIFSFAALGISLITNLIINRYFVTSHTVSEVLRNNNIIKYNLFVSLVAIGLTYLSWQIYVDTIFGGMGRHIPSFSDILHSIQADNIDKEIIILNVFANFIARQSFAFIIVLSIVTYVAHKSYLIKHGSRNDRIVKSSLIAAFYFAYLLILLLFYLYSSNEAGHSLNRYTKSYLLGVIMIYIFYSFRDYNIYKKHINYSTILMLTGVALWTIFGMYHTNLYAGAHELSSLRKEIRLKVKPLLNTVTDDDQIYIIWQNSNGYEFNLARYEMYPFRVNPWCWAFGNKVDDNDLWTCNTDIDKMRETLADYDYVFIGSSDETFWNRYGEVFQNNPNRKKYGIYKISNNGILSAHKIK
jgi:hypothetical protein